MKMPMFGMMIATAALVAGAAMAAPQTNVTGMPAKPKPATMQQTAAMNDGDLQNLAPAAGTPAPKAAARPSMFGFGAR